MLDPSYPINRGKEEKDKGSNVAQVEQEPRTRSTAGGAGMQKEETPQGQNG